MDAILKPYETQINEIARFAKKINYDFSNGIDELMKLWINEGRKFMLFVEDNKEDFIRVQKQFIK